MSSGNSTSPALPSRSRVAIVCSSMDRLIPDDAADPRELETETELDARA